MSNNNRNVIDKIMGMLGKFKTLKRLPVILSTAIPVLGTLLIIVAVVAIIFLPIMFFDNIKAGFYKGVDKTLTFLTTGKWMDAQNAYYQVLKDEYNKFERYSNKEGEFDIPLLAATSHYINLAGPNIFEYANDDDNYHKPYDEDLLKELLGSNEGGDLSYAIEGKSTRKFYAVAANELGRSTTIFPGSKRLIGHLVDLRIDVECKSWSEFFKGDDVNETSAKDLIKNLWSDFMLLTGDKLENLDEIINHTNIVQFIILSFAYKDQDQSYLANFLKDHFKSPQLSDEDNVIFFKNLARIIKQSNFGSCNVPWEIPVPTLIRFINYELYKSYLKKVYLRKFYINCKNCLYRDYTEEDKDIIADRMIDEIFAQKKAWDELAKNQQLFSSINAIYIPGLSSLPIPIPDGAELKISDTFRMREVHPVTGEKNVPHDGIDLAYVLGTPVLAIADGKVIHAGCQSNGCSKGYGYYIKLEHDIDDDGKVDYYSLYAHLSVMNVTAGLMVGGGQKIGEVGSTGGSTGPHLHFEIRDKNDVPIDPLPILKGIMKGTSVFDTVVKAKYYNQYDYRHTPYCEGMLVDGQPATIQNAGCLPSSYAIIVSKFGSSATPATVGNYICQNTNYRIPGQGTNPTFFVDSNVANHFKVQGKIVTNHSIDNIVSTLKKGNPIIVNIQGGYFNTRNTGHFMVLDSITNDGKIKILDPGDRDKSNVAYTSDEIESKVLNHIKSGIWAFEKR